jgi:uncharacterized membrane protein
MDTLLLGVNRVSTALLICGVAMWLFLPLAWSTNLVLHGGLMFLMAMPVVRLIGAIEEELRAREWGYVVLGIVVVLLLCGGVLVALRG